MRRPIVITTVTGLSLGIRSFLCRNNSKVKNDCNPKMFMVRGSNIGHSVKAGSGEWEGSQKRRSRYSYWAKGGVGDSYILNTKPIHQNYVFLLRKRLYQPATQIFVSCPYKDRNFKSFHLMVSNYKVHTVC